MLQEKLWILVQGFCILMNVYEFFNFSPLGSTAYFNRSWTMHLHYIWVSWKEKKQISTTIKINWSKIHFCNFIHFILLQSVSTSLISLLLQIESTTRRKCMTKVISDNTKNVKLYINLAPYSSWNYCWM